MPRSKPIKKNIPARREAATSLDLPDRFYIENNGHLSVSEIAKHLNKSEVLIQEFVDDWKAKHPDVPRTRKLMDRPTDGVISMTEAASMSGDDGYMKHVTLESINRAIVDGKLELAKELKIRYDEKKRGTKESLRKKYNPIIHYIETPDDSKDIY